jgi:hypothetical protein
MNAGMRRKLSFLHTRVPKQAFGNEVKKTLEEDQFGRNESGSRRMRPGFPPRNPGKGKKQMNQEVRP